MKRHAAQESPIACRHVWGTMRHRWLLSHIRLLSHIWLLMLLGLSACNSTGVMPTPTHGTAPVTPQPLNMVCPESLAPLAQVLASAYQQQNPAVQITVIQRADTLALQALQWQDADIALLTWRPDPVPATLWSTPIARDGLALVVHPQNGLPGLTFEQLRELFQGQIEDWAAWGGLPGSPQLISREQASGDYLFFQARVMQDARVALTALVAPTGDAMLDLVNESPLAIGYISTAHLDSNVRALAIQGVPPTPETLRTSLYPLTRELYAVTQGEPQNPQRAFIQWILDVPGQRIVVNQRFIPVSVP